MGLISQAVPRDQLMDTALETARGLARGATVALGMTKTLVDRSMQMSFEEMAEAEAFSQSVCRSSQDHREGLAAFTEKRDAAFIGK